MKSFETRLLGVVLQNHDPSRVGSDSNEVSSAGCQTERKKGTDDSEHVLVTYYLQI